MTTLCSKLGDLTINLLKHLTLVIVGDQYIFSSNQTVTVIRVSNFHHVHHFASQHYRFSDRFKHRSEVKRRIFEDFW